MAKDAGAQYDSAIQFAAKEFGVDPDILHGIAYAESRYNPKAVSPKGAQGMMQFMPDTAKRFGIDPSDPEQAIFGAAQYLKENLDKFSGDYGKAVAAYNWGENRKEYEQGDWVKKLPKETDSYVEQVLSYAADRAKPAEEKAGFKPAFPGSKAHLIPGAETDVIPTPRKEMGLVERVKDIGKGLVEIPGALVGGALREPIAAGVALATGRRPEEVGGQIQPVQSEFAKGVLGGIGGALEAAKVPALTPGMLTAPMSAGTQATRQAARPVVNELGMVKGAAENVLAERQARVAAERAGQSYQIGPRIDAAQEAQRLGINLDPGLSNPTVANRLVEKMVGASNVEKAVAESNIHRPTAIAKNELGIPENKALSSRTFAEARTAASKPYETIKNIGNFAADEGTITALNDLRQSEALIGGEATKGAIDKLVDSAITRVGEGLNGKDLLDNISNLRKDARTIYKKTDLSPEQRAVADTNIGIANALETLIEKNLTDNPKLLEQFREARTKMAKSYAYENATDLNTGLVDASKLAKLTAKDNALTGDIASLGQIAGNFPEAFTVKPRGALERGATYLARSTIPGSVGFLIGGPAGAITGAALGKVAEFAGKKIVTKRGYQAKRAVPKDYRNNLAPIKKLNSLAK